MTKIEVFRPAPDGGWFAPDAFAATIGKRVPFDIDGSPVEGGCLLVDARVVDGGAYLTLDVPVQSPAYGEGSFGFR